jgi:peptidoglycan/xylan/chitin deacetylase (PgdA/CDA1 family)
MFFDKTLRYFTKHKRLIITYHGISQKNQNLINGRHLLADQFEKHLMYFKKNFDIVSLETICEMKRNNIMPNRHTIAITFDDGFLNNLKVGLPLLERHKLQATFFCCSINLEDPKYLHPSDFLDLINVNSDGPNVQINGKVFERRKYNLICSEDGTSAYEFINSLSYQDWKTTLSDLSMKYPLERITHGIDDEAYKLINFEHLEAIVSSSVASIGSHCHSHVNVNMLTDTEMSEQFKNSKTILEKYSARCVNALAYPYGSYNKKALNLANAEGYVNLMAAGDVDMGSKKDIFPRMVISSTATFARNILSINKGFRRFGF